MPALKDITNQSFGRLIVICRVENARNRQTQWKCLCTCGESTIVRSTHLLTGHTKSCGCLIKEAVSESSKTHGMRETLEYSTWILMKNRCNNPNSDKYYLYGGRGIKVCSEWNNSFENFYADMGDRPTNVHSIDRKDNNGNYTPENCRWATQQEQCRNKRNNRLITYAGKSLCVAEWAELIGMPPSTIYSRLYRGWNEERVITTPKRY